MAKDRRYTTVKNLITAGYIKTFREMFDTLPKSVVARDLGMNNARFTRLMDNVDQFSLKELFIIASFLEVDEMVVLNLVLQQHATNKKKTTAG
jgi:hypothetical protein